MHANHIRVRVTQDITTRGNRVTSSNVTLIRDLNNIIPILKANVTSKSNPRVRFGLWIAQSINMKSASISEFVISERLDVLALTETWTSSITQSNIVIAEVINALQGYEFIHLPRSSRGGGVGLILKERKSTLQIQNLGVHEHNCVI